MARRGSFGRRRRGGSTNLSALVASLLREQRQAEDRAIFDAYNSGGLYKGKPVTDERIVAYMEGRRDSFGSSGKDDPLWDEWNNRIIQTKFSIGEQKIGLAFKQGRVGAGAVAAFYRDQLGKIPRNSAFYRTVAGRAADWAKSAASAARGAARGRATKGLRAKLNGQLESQQKYLALEAALTAYARRQGIISGSQELSDADATALQGMFDAGIYSGKDRITLLDFRQAAKDHYVALGGEINTRLALGQQAVEARNKRSRFLDETLVRLNAIDDRAKYEMAREVLIDKVGAANGDPYAIRAAYDAYAKSLKGIHEVATAAGAENANDPEFIGGLVNEFNAVTTGKNTGATVADIYDMDDEVGNGKELAEDVGLLNDDLDKLERGTAYFGQTEPGGKLGVVDWPIGTGTNPLGLDDSLQPSISNVNGERRIVYLKGEAVSASAIVDLNTGQAVDPTTLSAEALRAGLSNGSLEIETGGQIGFVFTNPVSGVVKYGVKDPATGQMFFTDENPWTSAAINAGTGGLTVFGTGLVERPDGRSVPDLASVFNPNKPVNIDTADPLLSDTTVAPKDLLSLVEGGALGVGFTDEQVASYQARLQRQESQRLSNLSNRDLGLTDRLGVGQADVTRGGGGDLAKSIQSTIAGISSITPTIQTLFGSPPGGRDRLFEPPPAPTPPAPAPALTGATLGGAAINPLAGAAAGAAIGATNPISGGAAAGAAIGSGSGQVSGGAIGGALIGAGGSQPKDDDRDDRLL